MSKTTNVLLTHGAWADGSCWAKVIPILQAQGLKVVAAQIPLTSLEDDIAVTRRMLDMMPGPTVLVGHSYGGAVITGAATGAGNVTALVYITGFGLDEHESLESLSKQGPPSAGSSAIGPDSNGFLWIDREGFHSAFVADGQPPKPRSWLRFRNRLRSPPSLARPDRRRGRRFPPGTFNVRTTR